MARDRFENVIADDGSSKPETLAILEEFKESLEPDPGFFRVISLAANSGGAARARNRTLDEATGAARARARAVATPHRLVLQRDS